MLAFIFSLAIVAVVILTLSVSVNANTILQEKLEENKRNGFGQREYNYQSYHCYPFVRDI